MVSGKRKPHFVLTLILIVIAVGLVFSSRGKRKEQEPIVYKESLDETAVEVNQETLTLRDMAFYVAYEEAEVEKKAVVYDSDHPENYWNMRVKGGFTRVVARNAAMQMAIHDVLFYQMAEEDGITLTEEDERLLKDAQEDFWADLTDREGEQILGVEKKDMDEAMRRIAYAQKYQAIYAELQGKSYEDYEFTAEAYKKLLKKQDYKINESVWKRVRFGSVTLVR